MTSHCWHWTLLHNHPFIHIFLCSSTGFTAGNMNLTSMVVNCEGWPPQRISPQQGDYTQSLSPPALMWASSQEIPDTIRFHFTRKWKFNPHCPLSLVAVVRDNGSHYHSRGEGLLKWGVLGNPQGAAGIRGANITKDQVWVSLSIVQEVWSFYEVSIPKQEMFLLVLLKGDSYASGSFTELWLRLS